MIEFSFDKYKIVVQLSERPVTYDLWLQHAKYFDVADLTKEGTPVYIGISQGKGWHEDVIAFSADPVDYGGFYPGFLLVAETDTFFIGAGTVIKIYDLKNHKKVFQKELSVGFWGWERFGEYVVMLEELEFGIYDLSGAQLWSTFVEPPWTYKIDNDIITLDVMDETTRRNIKTGSLLK